MKTALAIRHLAFEDLGSLEDVLRQRGIDVRYIEAGVDDLAGIAPTRFDLVVVLGGPIGVYATEQYPFLQQEIDWLQTRLSQDLPTLGICLGAQLMARALGANVFPGSNGKEIGWSALTVDLNTATEYPYLAPLLQDDVAVLHWHGDTYDLPSGARHLASSKQYPQQAFAWKKHGLALQFHLEVKAAMIERWLIGHACELSTVQDLTPNQLRVATRECAPALERIAPAFWNAWLDQLTARPLKHA
jgi:GMP synthase (glutamine-hydrolysing)